MRATRTTVLTTLLLALAGGSPAAQELVNPGFEDPGSPPVGWQAQHGAGNPQGRPSTVESSAGGAAEGRRALRLAGDADTLRARAASLGYSDVRIVPTLVRRDRLQSGS